MANISVLTPLTGQESMAKDSPNVALYQKMESIITQMKDPNTGVPIKTVKSFLTKIPDVFSGEDVVEWLMTRMKVIDQAEAIHLGSLIAGHGYFFPIDDHVITLKNDGTFYRFQHHQYWPSNGWEPENTDYAVYLCKRTMQNKARLELADYEAENLARLQRTFSKNWEQIFTRAESDAKHDRKRDKMQRKILDSQERAFWDVHRPVPGCVNTTELDIKKSSYKDRTKRGVYAGNSPRKPSSGAEKPVPRQPTAESLQREVHILQQQLDRHCLKMSKVCESLLAYYDQQSEYDALIVDPERHSQNPWIVDDEHQFEDFPVQMAAKWKFSFGELLKDEHGRDEFQKFLEKEFSGENLKFWLTCQRLKLEPVKNVDDNVNKIFTEFLSKESEHAINIDSKCMEITLKNKENPDRFCYEEAQEHIYQLMKSDSYARFIKSEQYKALLQPKKSEGRRYRMWAPKDYNTLTNESE